MDKRDDFQEIIPKDVFRVITDGAMKSYEADHLDGRKIPSRHSIQKRVAGELYNTVNRFLIGYIEENYVKKERLPRGGNDCYIIPVSEGDQE